MTDTFWRRQLKALIEKNALIEAPIKLRCGRDSGYYFDTKKVTLTSTGSFLVGKLFWRMIEEDLRGHSFDLVAGPELGAVPVVQAILHEAGTRGAFLRGGIIRKAAKEHGTACQVEGDVQVGDRTVIIEDVVTTGGSFTRSAEALAKKGATIKHGFALIDRRERPEGSNIDGVMFSSLFTVADFGLDPNG